MRLKIAGGRVVDPANGWHGEVRDLYVQDGCLAPPLTHVDRVIDAAGQVVCAAGVDLRGQVASYGLNFLRLWGRLPSPRDLGEAYARRGYTYVHEPFLTLATAGYVHRQLAALPLMDTSASLVLNLREWDLCLGVPERLAEVRQSICFLLEQTRSLHLRIVEPYVKYRQEFYAHRTVTMARMLEILTEVAAGQEFSVTLEASPELLRLDWPDPRAFHLGALGPALQDAELLGAALRHLAHGGTADLGLPAGAAAADPPVRVDLGWFQPLDLAPATDAAARGRALDLAGQYPGENLAFSGSGVALAGADHLPALFSRLGDAGAAPEGPQSALSRWVWMTRTLPARLLGLPDRGHLTPGARADVALYEVPEDRGNWGEALSRCQLLLKAGEIVVEDFQVVRPDVAKTCYFRRTGAAATSLTAELCQFLSFRQQNLWITDDLGSAWVGL
jgi:hypothetical protein